MYARIMSGRILPGKWDEFEAVYRRVIAARGPIPGLLTQWLSRGDGDPDACFGVSIWETKAALDSYVASAAHAALTGPLAPYFAGPFSAVHSDIRHIDRNLAAQAKGDLEIYHTN